MRHDLVSLRCIPIETWSYTCRLHHRTALSDNLTLSAEEHGGILQRIVMLMPVTWIAREGEETRPEDVFCSKLGDALI